MLITLTRTTVLPMARLSTRPTSPAPLVSASARDTVHAVFLIACFFSVVAEILAKGYKLTDDILQRAIEVDSMLLLPVSRMLPLTAGLF